MVRDDGSKIPVALSSQQLSALTWVYVRNSRSSSGSFIVALEETQSRAQEKGAVDKQSVALVDFGFVKKSAGPR
jgi:hypothetical protein